MLKQSDPEIKKKAPKRGFLSTFFKGKKKTETAASARAAVNRYIKAEDI